MTRFLAMRVVQALITLLVASFIVFALARLSGNPADILQSPESTPAERVAFIKRMGLDKPLVLQYWIYLKNALQGDFGVSLRTGRPVTELVFERLFNSLRLASAALLLSLIISLPLGVSAAVYRDRLWDRVAMTFALLGQSLPSFWVGIVGVLVFTLGLGWLPGSGIGSWKNYVLPAVTLGWFMSAPLVRLLRSSMLEVIDSEYVKFARVKGLSEAKVVWKHALRNALIPVVTFVGLLYGILIASAITTEVVFNWPGLGRLAYEAVLWRDFPLLQFTVLAWASLIIAINFIVDVVCVALDPRIRV
jgi:peptide/nickel transport system permease protein